MSAIITTTQSGKTIIADRLFHKFITVMDFPGSSEPVHQEPELRGNDLGPTVDFLYPVEIHAKSCLSLDQYLEVHEFKLIDEIVDTIDSMRFELLCHLILKASGFKSGGTMKAQKISTKNNIVTLWVEDGYSVKMSKK